MTSEQLKTMRRSYGVSQYKVALGTKISRFNISCFENGYIKFSDQEVGIIKKFFKQLDNKKDIECSKKQKDGKQSSK